MNKRLFLLASFLALTSCKIESYPNTFPKSFPQGYKSEDRQSVNVLEVGNLRWNKLTDLKKEKARLAFLIEETETDILVINGDWFLKADQSLIKKSFSIINSLNTPYVFIPGEEDYLSGYDKEFYSQANKNLFNDSSFLNVDWVRDIIIDPNRNNSDLIAQLYFMNSDEYQYYNSSLNPKGITCDRLDQLDKENGWEFSFSRPKFIFTHYPTSHFSIRDPSSDLLIGDQKEEIYKDSSTKDEDELYLKMKEDNVVAIFAAHDYRNDYAFYDDGIMYASCPRFNNDSSFYGSLLKLNLNHTFSYSNLCAKEGKDGFVMTSISTPTYKMETIYHEE